MYALTVLLVALLSAGCAASLNSSAGVWGKPAELTPVQTAASASDPLMAQANVARPSTGSSSKINGSASDATLPGPSTGPANLPSTAHAPEAGTPLSTDFHDNGTYAIGPLDILDISVFQVPNLTKSVQVSDTGTVNLPLVGEIPVVGKTPQEVERDLTARLGAKYVQNPQVTVFVKEFNSQSVTITGAVAKPGVYSIKGKASLLQVVAMAGGLGPVSDSTVLLLRQSNGKRSARKFDVSAIQDAKADDPAVQSGDQLLVGTSAIKQAFNTILKGLPIAGTAKGVAAEAQ